MQLTKAEIAETQIIVTTPEKWDVVTRKPTGEGELASVSILVKLPSRMALIIVCWVESEIIDHRRSSLAVGLNSALILFVQSLISLLIAATKIEGQSLKQS